MSAAAAVRHLRKCDPVLAHLIDEVGPCRFALHAEGTHLEAVLRSIVYQQLSGKAASTILGRVRALLPDPVTPAALLALGDAELRAAGLSRQKTSYLRDLAEKAHAGAFPMETLHELEDEAVVEALAAVKGVGRWTAQMFLMFRLGRPDVLPVGDLGIKKAMRRAYRLRRDPDPRRMEAIARAWQPHRTIACWYLWRSLEL